MSSRRGVEELVQVQVQVRVLELAMRSSVSLEHCPLGSLHQLAPPL